MANERSDFQDVLDNSPFSRLLGLRVREIGENSAIAELPLNENLFNAGGILHGGVLYSLADTTSAGAVMSGVSSETEISTLEGKLNFIGSVSCGECDSIQASATVKHQGSNTAVSDVDVSDDRGNIIAHGLFTFYKRSNSDAD